MLAAVPPLVVTDILPSVPEANTVLLASEGGLVPCNSE